MEQAELTTEQVLKRDIPWETYMMTKLISGTDLQLLRRYDNRPESYRAQLLDDVFKPNYSVLFCVFLFGLEIFLTLSFIFKPWQDGPAYVRVFVTILRDIFKEETVEYVLALIDEMLAANPKRARLFHDKSLANDDPYESFLRLLWKGNWFIQEKSCKILALIVSARPKTQDGLLSNGEASNSKSKITCIDDVLKGLVEWLCAQLKKSSHPSRSIPTAISCLATLLKEPVVRSLFVRVDGVKLLIPLICPASTQQSIQLLYETSLCVWLLSYYEPAIEYLATSRTLPRLVDVVKSSTKEKVVRVVVLTFKNLLSKGAFGAQMVDLGLPQIVQNLKAQAWSDEDLLEALNQLEEGLKDNIKKLSSFDKYKQEVLLGHLDWSPMHKDPAFWRENITNFEENDFQILRVLITILDTSNDPRALAVACFDLSQFIQHHPAGRVIVADLKTKERVMKLMNHENAEVTKNALLCIQRLFLGAKYASFLQV
ncbi:PREDICTED: V-type proton ATPase subunit H isoform X1 [Populus euphratica]|uniref:V-type proton ATPase subunit H n=1 Tax=Populus euphratica TaxID=75702 RepID=A0AAJ6VAU1_POPEU|nr:PREDICTED: V-type proton ATPase subunit H isoform X1 [Populus euphratica]XP_011044455.1 PREDICTED: V-type proton ATPase subunit H isoform X1 [Populus euphratica]XP_011044456.1 PREDICTED: V-type proton ATPase subunit H isoform X1 [Populus euphratica]XP_011044457.1 PREDICTED: V-type proton ATPase subunit H isoform X1 [Populus euphratica]